MMAHGFVKCSNFINEIGGSIPHITNLFEFLLRGPRSPASWPYEVDEARPDPSIDQLMGF